jgi:Na+-translocating ferredoxin:NAD+ oxidoreductase RnfD subunit
MSTIAESMRPTRAAPVAVAAIQADPSRAALAPSPRHRLDPRHYQIATLAGLLAYGTTRLDFEIEPAQAIVSLAGALLTQLACARLFRAGPFEPKSALISGLSLCLLLRTNSLLVALAAAVITIASKFVIRWKGKHVFNPTNLGVTVMLATGAAWVSPGQWGNVAFFAFLMACLGGLVVNRAARSDVTYAFLAAYLGIVFGYALWLGQPLAIPIHRLQNGAFLLFTFFMISDPRTTPDSRAGRFLFAGLVAALAAWITFGMFRTNGLLWALVALSPAVPLIDRFLPGDRHHWVRRAPVPAHAPDQGVDDEHAASRPSPGAPVAAAAPRV